jgi:hypothetical protein
VIHTSKIAYCIDIICIHSFFQYCDTFYRRRQVGLTKGTRRAANIIFYEYKYETTFLTTEI